jgi:predicted RNA-binding Zn-ribbon protein involved in translation (DUF1610 family)
VNQDSFRNFQQGLSEVSRWLFPLAVIWLLGAIGLGWIVKVSLIVIGLLLIAPVVLVLGVSWWFRRNLVQDQCPVCGFEFVGLDHSEFRCPSCSEVLRAEDRRFVRSSPPGTIDVNAVEVTAQTIED